MLILPDLKNSGSSSYPITGIGNAKILKQPASALVSAGQKVRFEVVADGTRLAVSDITQYKIYRYISNAKSLHGTVSASKTSIEIKDLSQGSHVFALASVDSQGLESGVSNRFTITIN